jgi:aldehyde:ferredoxin oxidoreductase
MDSIFKMNNVANDLGMDMHEMGQGMAVLMELQEEGIISPSDMDGISLTWGDHAAMLQMMEKVALREGIGNVLAEGIARAASHFGPEAERYVCHVKGMVLAALEPRMMKGTALGLATSTRGADHLRALVMAEFMPIMSPEEAEKKFGTADALELTSYNKAAATIYYQHLALLPDLFEICRFLFGMGQGTKSFSFDDLYELYRLATGIEADEEHMLKTAERIYTIDVHLPVVTGCVAMLTTSRANGALTRFPAGLLRVSGLIRTSGKLCLTITTACAAGTSRAYRPARSCGS